MITVVMVVMVAITGTGLSKTILISMHRCRTKRALIVKVVIVTTKEVTINRIPPIIMMIKFLRGRLTMVTQVKCATITQCLRLGQLMENPLMIVHLRYCCISLRNATITS